MSNIPNYKVRLIDTVLRPTISKDVIVLNTRNRMKNVTIESMLNHLHGCVNKKLIGRRHWVNSKDRVKFYCFVEHASGNTHINLMIDKHHKFGRLVLIYLQEFWKKITKKRGSLHISKTRSFESWLHYGAKKLNHQNESCFIYA